ncbi:hypothetical protein ACJX0J_033323, partial [Zea mays]
LGIQIVDCLYIFILWPYTQYLLPFIYYYGFTATNAIYPDFNCIVKIINHLCYSTAMSPAFFLHFLSDTKYSFKNRVKVNVHQKYIIYWWGNTNMVLQTGVIETLVPMTALLPMTGLEEC